MLRFNNKLIRLNGNLAGEVIIPPEPPGPSIPSDMDFIYFANDFDGTQVPNRATGTNAFGPYLEEQLQRMVVVQIVIFLMDLVIIDFT